MTVQLIQGILLAFAIVVITMPAFIRLVTWAGFAKQIRVEGPEGHLAKAGTPTAGGALLLGVVVGLGLYIALRLFYVWFVIGGGDSVDYYSDRDSEK